MIAVFKKCSYKTESDELFRFMQRGGYSILSGVSGGI